MDISELLSVVIFHDKAGVLFLNGPGWRKAAGGHSGACVFKAKPLAEQTNAFALSRSTVFSDGNRRAVEPTVEHESLPPTAIGVMRSVFPPRPDAKPWQKTGGPAAFSQLGCRDLPMTLQ
jgi:hypothetical protein